MKTFIHYEFFFPGLKFSCGVLISFPFFSCVGPNRNYDFHFISTLKKELEIKHVEQMKTEKNMSNAQSVWKWLPLLPLGLIAIKLYPVSWNFEQKKINEKTKFILDLESLWVFMLFFLCFNFIFSPFFSVS